MAVPERQEGGGSSTPSMLTTFRRTCSSLRRSIRLHRSPSSAASSSSTAAAAKGSPPTCLRPTSTLMHGASNEEASAKATTAPPLHVIPIKNDVGAAHSLAEQCEKVHRRVYELLAKEAQTQRLREVQRQTRISLAVIGEALERYTLDELSFSYNGGKDCLVLLILYLAALHTHATGQKPPASDEVNHNLPPTPPRSQSRSALPTTLRSVYIESANAFPQVSNFVDKSAAQYHLELAHYIKPMKEAFAAYLDDYPGVKAIFVGTRRTDPHGGKLTHFDPTDGGWPAFMRIHPVIDWHYADIWTFIREVGVEYCELYDMGYTSLGGTNDTHPNPALEVKGQVEGAVTGNEKKYRPAYELVDDYEERLGRDR